MKKLLVLLVLFLSGCASHVPFNKTDYALLGASSLALAADWRQTVSIKYNRETPKEHVIGTQRLNGPASEDNFILGNHPSDTATGAYFTTAILSNAAISYVLPPTYRKIWLSSIFAFELIVIRDNQLSGNVGLKTMW